MREEFEKAKVEEWIPITSLGRRVKQNEIKSMEEIFDKSLKIKEAGIVDTLVPNLDKDLLLVGQSRGKFGGGSRRIFMQVQKKTAEGNKPKFLTLCLVGNHDGYVGVGKGKAKETLPAREKATLNAKRNIFRISRGCGSWECGCSEPHSIPFKVTGRCGSVRVTLMPAPKGVGLCTHSELRKILDFAGIKDVWSRIDGQSGTRISLTGACISALKKLTSTRVNELIKKQTGMIIGAKQ